MFWHGDKQTGRESYRQSGDSRIREKKKRGFQESFPSDTGSGGREEFRIPVRHHVCLIFQEIEWLTAGLWSAAVGSHSTFQLCKWAVRLWNPEALNRSTVIEEGGNVSLDTGPPVTDYSPPSSTDHYLWSYYCSLQKKKKKPWVSLCKEKNLSISSLCFESVFHRSTSPLSACLTELKIENGHICTREQRRISGTKTALCSYSDTPPLKQ